MKILIIFLFVIQALTVLASESVDYTSDNFKQMYCYELADWRDHDMEDLDYCLSNIKVLNINFESENVDVTIYASLNGADFVKANFIVNDKGIIVSMH